MNRHDKTYGLKLGSLLLAGVFCLGCHTAETPYGQNPDVTNDPVAVVSPTAIPAESEDVVVVDSPVSANVSSAMPTAAPTVTPEPTATPVPEPEGLIGWSVGGFVDRENTVHTETEYISDKLHITVTKIYDHDRFTRYVTYFVSDVYVRDINCLRTYPATEFTSKEQKQFKRVHKIAESANALWAMTGDYCGHHTHSLIIRNGVVYDTKLYSDWDLLFLYTDGTMEVMKAKDYSADALRDDIWQAWQFGPSLLDSEGHAISDFGNSKIKTFNPRSIFGYVEPGHYIFVTVEGRQNRYSGGLNLAECAELMESLGCVLAFNLDGGESAELYWNGGTYNQPCDGGRVLSDIIYLIDEDESETP